MIAFDDLLQLYEKFITGIEAKLDQLQFVQILAAINAQYYPSRPYVQGELERAEAQLASFVDKKTRLGSDAFLVLQMEILSLKLKRASLLTGASAAAGTTLLDECKKEMVAGKDALESLPDGTDPVVTATVHRVAAEYYKLRGPAHLLYQSLLLFLGHTPLDLLSSSARTSYALDVAVSALVGEGIYAFGEVNAHPILQALNGGQYAWMVELLKVFQNGDIEAYEKTAAARKAEMGSIPQLASPAAGASVKEKITLLRLMELAASRAAHARSLAFADIAAACRVPADSVEHLALRSLSLGLLKGTIDQVDQVRA